MKKPNKRKYPDAMHEAMDIPSYEKPIADDGAGSPKNKKPQRPVKKSKK
jgi:hypothetical protein